jgi:hypothetical protein
LQRRNQKKKPKRLFLARSHLATGGTDHGEVSDLSTSTKVEAGETDDADLLVGLGATGTGPSGGVL